jgi:N-acetylglucosamine-6-phosphate deacetylase
MKTALIAAKCVTPLETIANAVVLVEDGVISSIGPRSAIEIPPGTRVRDYGDAVLAPGFMDIHIHGGGGHDVMEGDPDALAAIERHLATHGTTSYFPTTVTAPFDQTLRSLEKLADRIETNGFAASSRNPDKRELWARPLGIHLEGPFISTEKRGVHPLAYIKDASLELFERMWQAARGHVKIMTIAPEIAGAEELIREASRRGVCVSLGHSNACQREAKQGIAAGATHITHTFNAMRPMESREPGILGTALTDDRLSAEVIADGVHVAPEMVRLFLRAKGPEHAVLVTDALSAAGMPDGSYRLGNFMVDVKNNRCLSEGRLAGSVLTLDRAVRNVMEIAAWPLETAVRLATLNPAEAVKVANRKGILAPGADADLVVLTPKGELVETIVACY